MELILATGNQGKLKEFREAFGSELKGLNEVLDSIPFIEESADSFAGNALIKAREIYKKLGSDYIVMSDDSGISVPILGGEPGIYSARYAGEEATDRDNLNKLIDEIKKRSIKKTPAYYTASIALVSRFGEYVVHGWMYGDIIDTPRGDRGFGYDPIFIPKGYDKTLGELEDDIKANISHRAKAIDRIRPILKLLQKKEEQ